MSPGAPPKFNFIPEKQLTRECNPVYKVTIYSKESVNKETGEVEYFNNLIFTKEVVSVWDLGGKWIRFYADKEKKAVGWSIFDKASDFSDLEGIRQFKVNKQGICTFGIGRLLKSIGVNLKENKKGLLVETHRSLLQASPINYIKL